MTDFSRNQIGSIRLNSKKIDPWVIPNDRQLLLRSKLGTGWSSRTNAANPPHDSTAGQAQCILSNEELKRIADVIQRAEIFDQFEKQRIGNLVNHYDRLKNRSHGDGTASCKLCGEQFNFRSHSHICMDCHKAVCPECSIDTRNSKRDPLMLCKICSERRELWKRSGAWFFGEIPPHSEAVDGDMQPGLRSTRPLTPRSSPHLSRRSSPHGSTSNVSFGATAALEEADDTLITTYIRSKGYNSSDDDDDDDDLLSVGNYPMSLSSAHLNPPDLDAISTQSFHVKNNPLLAPLTPTLSLKSTVSLGSIGFERQESATESIQDLRAISLKPNKRPELETVTISPRAERSGVTFGADVQDESISARKPFYARCESIPNADLSSVAYQDEDDQQSPFGSLTYTIFYDESEEKMDIEVLGSKNLPDDQPCNPFVSSIILPSFGKSRKQRSRTQYNTTEPSWKEKLTYFGISVDDLLNKNLVLSVMSEHLLTADSLIGGFRLPLRQIRSYELTQYQVFLEKSIFTDSDRAVCGDDRGKIQLSLRYDNDRQQLVIAVVRCAALHLPSSSADSSLNPYVKLYLQPDYTKSSKNKTPVAKKTHNPEFHKEIVYSVELAALAKRSLEVSVWDHNMLGNSFIGGVCLAATSNVMAERNQWLETLTHSGRRHDQWHCLRDTKSK